jgi:FkbM family methyltransferase
MGLWKQAKSTYCREGFRSLLRNGLSFALESAIGRSRQGFYRAKARFSGDHTVTVNGVQIDLRSDAISKSMVQKLRTRRYETAETRLISSHLSQDVPALDLGAGVGYTTCLLDQFTEEGVPVVGLEADNRLRPVIERTKELNDSNFEILNTAYHSSSREIEFGVAEDFWVSSRYEHSNSSQTMSSVPARSVSDVLEEFSITGPFQLVVDIEGSEGDLIVNERDLLERRCELLIVEFHSIADPTPDECRSVLSEIGFERVGADGNVEVYSAGNRSE